MYKIIKLFFLNYFVQSYFDISTASSLSYNPNAKTFTGGIGEGKTLNDVLVRAMAEAYKESGYSKDFLSFEAIQFMSAYSGKEFENCLKNVMGGQDALIKVKKVDNNGFESHSINKVSNRNLFDIIVGLFKEHISDDEIAIHTVSFETKHSTVSISSQDNIIHNVVVDHLRKIHMNKYIVINTESDGNKKIRSFISTEHYNLALNKDPAELEDVGKKIWRKVNELQDPFHLNHLDQSGGESDSKGDDENKMNLAVGDLLRTRISRFIESQVDPKQVSLKDIKDFVGQFKNELIHGMSSNDFKDSAELYDGAWSELYDGAWSELYDILRKFYTDAKISLIQDELLEIFDSFIEDLDIFMVKNEISNRYEFLYHETLRAYKETEIKLTRQLLINMGTFIILDNSGELKNPSEISENDLKNLNVPLIWVHKGSQNGFIRADYVYDSLKKLQCRQLPSGVEEGFKTDTGETILGLYAFNEHGKFLESRI